MTTQPVFKAQKPTPIQTPTKAQDTIHLRTLRAQLLVFIRQLRAGKAPGSVVFAMSQVWTNRDFTSVDHTTLVTTLIALYAKTESALRSGNNFASWSSEKVWR